MDSNNWYTCVWFHSLPTNAWKPYQKKQLFFRYYKKQLETVIYQDTPAQREWVLVDNTWIAIIEHPSKSQAFYLPIHTENVLQMFGFEIQSQTEVRVQKPKNPIWPPGGHFESEISANQ